MLELEKLIHDKLNNSERINTTNGKFEIKSVVNKGTTIFAEIYDVELAEIENKR